MSSPAVSSSSRVSRTFRTTAGEVQALAEMSLRAAPHEVVAVVGPSGCGKTHAARADLRPAAARRRHGPQRPGRADAPARPAAALAGRARQRRARPARAGVPREEARAHGSRRGSSDSGWPEFERTRPAELSGGMRQRVSFLRTLLAGKPVLALDEPFASLDAITRSEMQGWLGHVLEQRAADGRAGDPRRRGGGRARPTAWW